MRKLLIAGASVAGAVYAYRAVVEPWWRTWGVRDLPVDRSYRGDDVITEPTALETRSIVIDAPPERIWPWLVQMGYGRAGWYSYDAIDMTGGSTRDIVPRWQALAVGDIVPTHPGGGFVVRILEPGQALVLYSDTALVRDQSQAATASGDGDMPANLQATSSFLAATQPMDFAASWAFILEPVDATRTRLIERFRVRFGADDRPWTKATLPVVGFGVFLMVRRQLLGLRDRVEGMEPAAEVPTDGLVIPAGHARPTDDTPPPSAGGNGRHAVDPADGSVAVATGT
jgi:hypothetical protein